MLTDKITQEQNKHLIIYTVSHDLLNVICN